MTRSCNAIPLSYFGTAIVDITILDAVPTQPLTVIYFRGIFILYICLPVVSPV